MRVKTLKDGVAVFTGNESQCEMFQAIMKELKSQHVWTIERVFDSEISDVPFAPIVFTKSNVSCQLKEGELVLDVPDLRNYMEQKRALKRLGFVWRRAQYWSADYIDERSTDDYRDSLIEILKLFDKGPMPAPPTEKSEYEKRVEADKKLFGGG